MDYKQLSKLPANAGTNKNRFLKWRGNGKPATSYTVEKKNNRPMPCNWPTLLTRFVNAQCKIRGVGELLAIVDTEAHMPQSLQLVGRHHHSFPVGDQHHNARRTRSALLVGVNYFDRTLEDLEYSSYRRGSALYLKTNLSLRRNLNDLSPVLLHDIPDIRPEHFHAYVYGRHLLGVKVDCSMTEGKRCVCLARAEGLLPAMWIHS